MLYIFCLYRMILMMMLTQFVVLGFVCTDSNVVIHGSSGLHLLLCTGAVASCQVDSPHAELSAVRWCSRKMQMLIKMLIAWSNSASVLHNVEHVPLPTLVGTIY